MARRIYAAPYQAENGNIIPCPEDAVYDQQNQVWAVNEVRRAEMSDEKPLAGHTFTFVDPDGDERCECEKWLEPGYYEWEDHLKSVRREIGRG